MTPAQQLARDLALLNALDSADLLAETARAERAEALGGETANDKTYRAALEKLAP
ncbi:hypothetical protein [Streptosporangium sp. NPDC049078]|uniref:hypothetical protein n=1 Tax=Streptosporangium sp. NPDC049078 TaxID=3155767 RepID=UPI00341DEA5C